MQWPRLIYSHIPYHLSHKNQKEYYEILKKLLYSSIAKMIHETNTYQGRKSLKKKLLNDIRPMKLPMLLNIVTQLMVNLNNQYVLKVYLYYLMPLFVKKVTLEKQNKN